PSHVPISISLLSFTAPSPTTLYPLSLHDALPIYTFTFPVCPKECCLWTTAYLQVTFKALQGGPPGSATSANDYVSIWVNGAAVVDRKSTRLNSSHLVISYAVFCLKKKKKSFLIDR